MATPTATSPNTARYFPRASSSRRGSGIIQRRWKTETNWQRSVEAFGKYLVSKRILTPCSRHVQRGRPTVLLDRYKILDQIGKGQMGGVYKAVHSLGQMVPENLRRPGPRISACWAASSASPLLTQLDHPNVVGLSVGESAPPLSSWSSWRRTLDECFTAQEAAVGEACASFASSRRTPAPSRQRMVHRD